MFTIKYECKEDDRIRLQKMLENNEFDKFLSEINNIEISNEIQIDNEKLVKIILQK